MHPVSIRFGSPSIYSVIHLPTIPYLSCIEGRLPSKMHLLRPLLGIATGIFIVGGAAQQPRNPRNPNRLGDVAGQEEPEKFHFYIQTTNRPPGQKLPLEELHPEAARVEIEAGKLYQFSGQPPFRMSTAKDHQGVPRTVMAHVHDADPADVQQIHLHDQHGKPLKWETGGGPLSNAVHLVDPDHDTSGLPPPLSKEQLMERAKREWDALERDSAGMTEKMMKAKTPEHMTALMHEYSRTRERLHALNPVNTDARLWRQWTKEQDESYLRQLVSTAFA